VRPVITEKQQQQQRKNLVNVKIVGHLGGAASIDGDADSAVESDVIAEKHVANVNVVQAIQLNHTTLQETGSLF